MNRENPIGVFDSGFGGISVVATIREELPNEDILFFGDSKYNPYGTKTKEEITQRCVSICDTLMEQNVKAIVVACNTATSACVNLLRQRYPVDIIGMEPALKVACDKGKNQRIAVWATELTLKEQKFKRLMDHFKDEHTIYSVACPNLVQMVEQNQLDDVQLVQETLEEYINATPSVDSIVLGCTHFVFYKKLLKEQCQGVDVIDGNHGTVAHLKTLLEQKDLLQTDNRNAQQIWMNSLDGKTDYAKELLKRMEEEYDSMGNI